MTSVMQRLRGVRLVKGWARWPVALAGALTIAYIVWIATGAKAQHAYAVTQVLYLPVGFVAVGLSIRTAWSRRAQRRDSVAWALVAASLAAFWLGDVLYVVAESLHASVESPAWSDIGYLVYYPLLLGALVLLSPPSGSRAERFKVSLDVATIFLGGTLLVWYFVLRPALEGLGAGLGDAITVAYPLGDLLLILGIGNLAMRRSRFRSRPALVTLLTALLVGFAADLAYGYVSTSGANVDTKVTDAVYLVAWFLFALAAALEHSAGAREDVAGTSEEAPVAQRGGGLRLLPYVAIVVAISVLVWALRNTFDTVEGGAAVIAVLITIVAMARQIAAMNETSRLREQQSLQSSEERFERALRRTQFSVDHAADSMIWIDSGGRIVDVNRAACLELEYSRDELLGMTVFQITGDFEGKPGSWEAGWQKTKEQGSRVIETEHHTKFGRVIPVEVIANFVDYEGDEFSVCFGRDVSERKRAERALHETEAQLRQAQKMDAIGQLAGGIAHDFNNLLTAIVGYCDLILLSGDDLSQTARADVGEIKAAADRATALTRQILLFSRRQPLQPEAVVVNDVVTDVQRLLSRTLGEHVELVTILDPDAGRVEVDVAQFEQAIMNLAVNARDAMPQGGRLTIETGRVDIDVGFCFSHPGMRPGTHVVLAVSDTGVGMDEETKTRAFEPFFTTKEVGKGTGLGLATVYGTVRQSRGGIFIYSEPGHGTSAKIYLPRLAETPAGAAEDGSVLPVAAAHGTREQEHSETVLVVEDEEGIRQLVKRVLESRGFRVVTAATAHEAVVLLENGALDIDMLLTDVILAGQMQGGELAQRALVLRPRLPVLYMSGYTRDTVLQAGRLQDGMHYLEKPFSPDVLVRRVREVLDQGPGSV